MVILIVIGFGIILIPVIVAENNYNRRDNSSNNFNNHNAKKNNIFFRRRRKQNKTLELLKSKPASILGPPRQPLPGYLRNQIYYRAQKQCENPFCKRKEALEIHHIDMNHENNKLCNLIALCKKCHEGAHSGIYPPKQVHNWMSMDYNLLLKRQSINNPSIYQNQ